MTSRGKTEYAQRNRNRNRNDKMNDSSILQFEWQPKQNKQAKSFWKQPEIVNNNSSVCSGNRSSSSTTAIKKKSCKIQNNEWSSCKMKIERRTVSICVVCVCVCDCNDQNLVYYSNWTDLLEGSRHSAAQRKSSLLQNNFLWRCFPVRLKSVYPELSASNDFQKIRLLYSLLFKEKKQEFEYEVPNAERTWNELSKMKHGIKQLIEMSNWNFDDIINRCGINNR